MYLKVKLKSILTQLTCINRTKIQSCFGCSN